MGFEDDALELQDWTISCPNCNFVGNYYNQTKESIEKHLESMKKFESGLSEEYKICENHLLQLEEIPDHIVDSIEGHDVVILESDD